MKWIKYLLYIVASILVVYVIGLLISGAIAVWTTVGPVVGKGIVSVVLYTAIIYFFLRIATMILAPREILFCSPKLGRIKVRVRNGRNIGFLAHLKGLTGELPKADGTIYYGPVHINEKTGQILEGKERIWDLWWVLFGVRFIGLDGIRRYEVEKVTISPAGEVIRENVTAGSLHFSGIYPVITDDLETIEGVRGDLRYTITVQTTHAGESMKYANWINVMMPPVKGTAKDYVSGTTVQGLITARNELSDAPDSFVNCMRTLNNDGIGNISLHRRVGQRITAASLTDVAFEDQIAKAMEAKKAAEATGDALIAEKTRTANAKVEEVRGQRAEEDMKTAVMQARAAVFAGPGGVQLAAIEQARLMAVAIEEHEGTLVLNSQAIPTVPTT